MAGLEGKQAVTRSGTVMKTKLLVQGTHGQKSGTYKGPQRRRNTKIKTDILKLRTMTTYIKEYY